jgi:tetratricopeptide (TPR) repeat protein
MFRLCCALLLGLAYGIAVAADSSAAASPQDAAPAAGQGQPTSAATAATAKASAVLPATPVDLPPARPSVAALPDPLGEARILSRKGDFDGAIQKYQQLLQERPKSPDAYAGLTHVYLKKKDVTRAFETVSKGLQVNDAWPTRVALGEVYFRQGKITEAEKEWVGVINAGHAVARAYLGLARVRWALSMNKSAKAMIDKAHELDPKDLEIQKAWIDTLRRSERIEYYEDYLAGPNDSDPDERGDLQNYLSYLKERAKLHDRPCRLASKVTSTETPLVRLLMDPEHLRGYGLSVTLNGITTKLLLDTGASGIVVNRRIADRAGLAKLTETKIWGIGDKGRKNAYIAMTNSIRIGELEFQNCPVEVMDSRSVAKEDGLIGANVFEDFLVEIDFPWEKLKLSELPKRPGQPDRQLALKNDDDDSDGPEAAAKADSSGTTGAQPTTAEAAVFSGPQDRYIAPEMQSFTRVFRFGHDLLVPTKIGDAPYKLFLLDSGALTNAISPEAAREVTKVRGDSDMIVKGISGSVKKVYSANKAVLEFGHLRQENQDMLSFDTSSISEAAGTEISGFLGFVTLRWLNVKIDYRDGLVDFNYDRERFNHF